LKDPEDPNSVCAGPGAGAKKKVTEILEGGEPFPKTLSGGVAPGWLSARAEKKGRAGRPSPPEDAGAQLPCWISFAITRRWIWFVPS